MKHIIVNNKSKIHKIISYLIEKESLPTIHVRLNIYPEDESFQIEVVDNTIKYRNSNKNKTIYIKNKNFKYFLKSLNNDIKYYINEITILRFKTATILFNTYHGIIISIDNDELCDSITKQFDLTAYDNISKRKITKKRFKESLFDEIGNLNNKIKHFGIKTGLDLRSVSNSLKIRLSNLSNNYSHLEDYYRLITNDELLTTKSVSNKTFGINNMSIIIPVYNQDVSFTLLSIQGQKLSKEDKKKIQVIVINDGSVNDVLSDIEKVRDKLDYEVDFISFNENMGLSNARNVGYAVAKYDILLFLDSDIVLSKDYIYDMNTRAQIIPNAIFTCMRRNIEKDSKLLKEKSLLSGVVPCKCYDDSRVITEGKDYHIGSDSLYLGEEISVLDDTDFFKELGFGSQIGIYNIATVVAGHNILINKSLCRNAKPFNSDFKGWGMEDAYFASKLISDGCYVIPVLSSCVYHINHPPRSGSAEKKRQESLRNYNLYNDLLAKDWNELF